MKARLFALTATALLIGSAAFAADPKVTIADLEARLAKAGEPRIEGTEEVAGQVTPALYFGERKINNNVYIVDSVRRTHLATATVFVKSGNEFVRVSTNVLTPEGKRGLGTLLAHNAAYDALSTGRSFCGPVDVLGTAFDACYSPVKDSHGQVIGATYVGHKK